MWSVKDAYKNRSEMDTWDTVELRIASLIIQSSSQRPAMHTHYAQ